MLKSLLGMIPGTLPIKPDSKPTAFDKRVKRRISGREHQFFAVCPPGLRGICQNEIAALPGRISQFQGTPQNIQDIRLIPGGIEFKCRLETACLVNLLVGSATRILMRIAQFKADRFDRLEKKTGEIDWELYLPHVTDPDIRVTTRKSRLYHSDAIADRIRPLILERLKKTYPSANEPAAHMKDLAGQTLMVRADNDRFELSLDMSGLALFKRGIKEKVVKAPLRETLAFAMLSRLNLSSDDILVDPMCGSGTFSLEGAMIQAKLPPGTFRRFAFEAWPGFKQHAYAHVKNKLEQEAENKNDTPFSRPILASDLDQTAILHLTEACKRHKVFHTISATCMDFFDALPPKIEKGKGVVVLNPPYGIRLGRDMDMTKFFKEIGIKLRADFKGWRTGIIYPEQGLGKSMNLSLSPMPLFHGGLDLHAGIGIIPG